MLQNNSLGVTATQECNLVSPSLNVFKKKMNKTTIYLSKVPKDKSSPLALTRANLVFDEYCKIGLYEKDDRGEIFKIHSEYENDPNSSSYLLFDLGYGFINGRVTATYTIDEFHKLPSYTKGYWRQEDIDAIIRRKGSELEGKVAEISKFATNPKAGKNSSMGLMRIYGKVFSEIKKHTDNIFISACEKDLNHYIGMGLGEAFKETKHNSEELKGAEVVVGYISLSNTENSKVHDTLKKRAVKETPAEDIENLGRAYIGYLMGNGNSLWNCI